VTPDGDQPDLAPTSPTEVPPLLPRRPALPARFLLVLAAGLAALMAERLVDLSYTLLGDGTPVDLGTIGGYDVDPARAGAHVRMEGLLGPHAVTYDQGGRTYEVRQFVGTGVLVSRLSPDRRPAADEVEAFTAQGRLLHLATDESNLATRLFDRSTRYAAVRRHFEARRELPVGSDVFLILDGDVPRGSPLSLVLTLTGLVGVLLLLAAARRSAQQSRRHRDALARLPDGD
jgi:hypothetical protein